MWDARGNVGGYSLIAIEIASGFPGARPEQISTCASRVEGSEPPAYTPDHPGYTLAPPGTFASDVDVAVLVDGGAGSAGDYFALAALATDAVVVGERTSGAFGGPTGSATFGSVTVGLDIVRCTEPDWTLLEAAGVEPNVEAPYVPSELARGGDPVLDAALRTLGR